MSVRLWTQISEIDVFHAGCFPQERDPGRASSAHSHKRQRVVGWIRNFDCCGRAATETQMRLAVRIQKMGLRDTFMNRNAFNR